MISSGRHSYTAPESGFTLLEVLGAVAILGVSYLVLASTSIGAIQGIGREQRRIEASLLADQTISELEIAVQTEQPLTPRQEEFESGPFTVVLEVLDMSLQYEGNGDPNDAIDLLEFLGNEANGEFAPHRDKNLLLGYLREVHVAVRWEDGPDEFQVTRTAFLYDHLAWSENEAVEAEQDEDGEDSDDDGGAEDLLDQLPPDLQQQVLDETIGAQR